MTKWLWIGGLGVLALVLLNNLGSANGGGGSKTASQCLADPTCLTNFWKWQINRSPVWKANIEAKALQAGITYDEHLMRDITWMQQQNWVPPAGDLATYVKTL